MEGDHISLSAMRGCVSDVVTCVPSDGGRGSVELASCCSEVVGSSEEEAKEPSELATIKREKNGGKDKKQIIQLQQ